MANKMTNKGALQFVLDTYDVPEDVAEKLTSMLTQLEKKSGAERKPTARQVENAKIKDKILSQMEPNVLYTVGEMLKKFDTSEDMTSQRLTALLSQMTEDGSDYASILKEAQAMGYAEANPAADVEGWDAARKAVILASIGFNTRINLEQVSVEGITHIEPADINYANELGYVIKLLAVAKDYGEKGVNVRVHPVFLPSSHPLAAVKDVFNAIFLRGNAIGDAMFYGRGAGSLPTASAVVADIIGEARNIVSDVHSVIGCTCYNSRAFCPIEETESSYYVRLHVDDEPGVLGSIATAFGESGVSLKSVIQTRKVGVHAEIVAVTHVVQHRNLQKAADVLQGLKVVDSIRSIIRVEEN